ncbi:MAG TPA: hypothetical protein VG818_00980, partial [Gemmatimonadaceae bacterium]|nr:hypothetical protein [Gemmatimonadaceae bacterium]
MMPFPSALRHAVRGVAVLAVASAPLFAQDVQQQVAADRALLAKETYVTPPAAIEQLVTAPWQQNVTFGAQSPDRTRFLREVGGGLPTVNTFGKPHYYFAGLQVDYQANRSRALTDRGAVGLQVIDGATGKATSIEVPAGATVSSPVWSPDGSQVAFIANFENATQAYVADASTGKSHQVTRTPLLATLVTTLDWTHDGKSLVVVQLPDNRGPEPKRPAIATGPTVRMNDGEKRPNREFASLLDDPYDKAQMEYYVTGQLAVVDVKTRATRKVGAPAMIQDVDASPDAKYFRVTVMQKPFSYLTQYTSFGSAEQLWDADGRLVATLASRPLRDGEGAGPGFGGGDTQAAQGDTAKRSFGWLPSGAL